MATRSCPECGAQYVATVRRCIDCDVVLVDDAGPDPDRDAAPSTAAPVGAGDQVGYELEGWGNQLKVTLEGMLARAGIGRVWEAGALVVAAADEDLVDDLIATLEGGDLPDLDDDVPRVALEIEGLDADSHAELDARLLAGAVPHAWDEEGALVVAEADEEQVLAVIDEVLAGPPDDGDGLAALEALSALYVAVDRLVKQPHDPKLASAYRRAVHGCDGLSTPYGFGAADWDDLLEEADRLARVVAGAAGLGDRADPPGGEDASEPVDGDREEPGDDGNDGPGDAAAADEGERDGPGNAAAADEGERDEAGNDGDGDSGDGDGDGDGPVPSVEESRAAARALRARLADLV